MTVLEPMRLLVLARYSRLGASSRLRTMQYEEALKQAGIEPVYSSLFDDAYVQALYDPTARRRPLREYLAKRLAAMRASSAYDAVWLEKEALPWVPFVAENFFLPRRIPIIVDYDDAIFHRYDADTRWPVRIFLGQKIDKLMRRADAVFAGNSYLADRAMLAGASRVEIVPTALDITRYRGHRTGSPAASPQNQPVRIVWIGTPITWSAYMADTGTTVVEAARAAGAEFVSVGGGAAAAATPGVTVLPWSEAAEADIISEMDIGVMPLDDSLFAKGKCGYKLLQYMACSLPVIASPVGVNCDIVEPGINGFLASDEGQWRKALATLVQNPDLRRQLGREGRRKVEDHYSTQVWAPRIAGLLRAIGEGRR